ncbi:10166_t:CDS:1, partial [Gigaspora rosea]
CNGNVLRDPGFKSCDSKNMLYSWNEAPSLYCVHAYPQIHPQRNRYQEVYNSDSCFGIYGGEEDWSFDPQDMKYCQS